MTCIEEAKEELRHQERPALKKYLEDISKYDNIVVAGSCWWRTYPMAIFSQLEKLDFKDKKVFPVMTHEGSGLAGATSALTLKRFCKRASVGKAIKESGIDRKEIWATSKLWPSEYGEGKTSLAIDKMLKRLDMDYIDLLLLHQQIGDYLGAWVVELILRMPLPSRGFLKLALTQFGRVRSPFAKALT